MKDRVTLIAIVLLIFLVAALILISLENNASNAEQNRKIHQLTEETQEIKTSVKDIRVPKDGKTPVFGVDYFNGKDSVSNNTIEKETIIKEKPLKGKQGGSAYQSAVKNGYKGTEEEWIASLKGEPARELDIFCIDNIIMKRYFGDTLFQPTNIRCEATNE